MKLLVRSSCFSLALFLHFIDPSEQGNVFGALGHEELHPVRLIHRHPLETELGPSGFRRVYTDQIQISMADGTYCYGYIFAMPYGEPADWMRTRDSHPPKYYTVYMEIEKEINEAPHYGFYQARYIHVSNHGFTFKPFPPGTKGPVHALIRFPSNHKDQFLVAEDFQIYDPSKYTLRISAERRPLNQIFILMLDGTIYFSPLKIVDVQLPFSRLEHSSQN